MFVAKSTLFVCILSLFGALNLSAQQGPGAAGGDAHGSGGSVSYTFGQTDYISSSGANGSLNQGLQQPYEIQILTGVEETGIVLNCSVYPNPASDFIQLSIASLEDLAWSYELYDMQGKLVGSNKVSSVVTSIPLSGLPDSSYLIRIVRSDKAVKSYKIIKSQ